MRTTNYKLITLLLAATYIGTGCTDEDVLQSTTGENIPNSGTVSQKNFVVTAGSTSLDVYDAVTDTYTAQETTITASIGDRNNQTLTDSHTIYFQTEYGLIEPSCITQDGTCSVTWESSSLDSTNFPANDTSGVFIGSPATTIIAYTGGEESFTDINSNGLYDDADGGFLDIEEPYIDVDNNGVYDIGTDIIRDFVNGNDTSGINEAHDIADGFFNGSGCTHSTNCSTLVTSAVVWDAVVIKLDGGAVAQFTVGGNVTGLTGTLVLQNNGGDDYTLTADGAFTFATGVDNASGYAVTVLTQPAGQTCSVTNGNGTIASADETNVVVNCVNNYSLGGNISGLIGSITLLNNGGDNLTITADGAFTFATQPADGSAYNVTAQAQPTGQVCTVTNGTGTIAGADVTSITITCVSTPYTIGGTISGLSGSVVLQNNLGDELTVSANGSFTFATSAITGDGYSVTVLTDPVGKICTPSNASGTVSGADVTSVTITCVNDQYSIGGIITGSAGTMVLDLNGNPEIFNVTGTGNFVFTTQLTNGTGYTVTVNTPPTGQACNVTNGTGTVAGANITNISISCTTNLFTIGGTVSNLLGSVTLQNNLGDNLIINTTGTSNFTFATPIVDGNPYSVTVLSQPPGQTCTVTGGAGTVTGANVTGVGVNCANNPFNISGTLSGLSGSITLQNNGGDDLVLTADGGFTFASQIDNGSTYNVTVSVQPASQLCTVSNGSGTVVGGNVTTITVNCATLYTVGGNVSGLTGSVTLQNNSGDDLIVSANGTFTFATGLLDAAAYSVTVLTQPAGQTCTVTNAGGNISVANVTNVTITCADNTIGGTLTGLVGDVTLQNNGGDDLTILAGVNGPFIFATPLDNGATYSVTVSAQPAGQTCSVTSGGTGTITGPITTVTVDCI